MRHRETSQTPGDTRRPPSTSRFMRLHDLDDYRVARGDPDVRGWHVKTRNGERAGKVDSLIVDTEAMQVRYLDVELDRKTYRLNDECHVLVPLAYARLDEKHDDVLLDSITAAEMAELQPYHPGQAITPEPAAEYRDTDARQFYGTRGGTGSLERRTEAGMAAGDVSTRRRQGHTGGAEDQEVRIPLTGDEEVVIEKRAVPTEELVIRKKPASDQPPSRDSGPRRDH